MSLATSAHTPDSTESTREVIFREAGTLSKLFVNIPTNTTTANSTIRTRKNGANGGQSVTIGSGATGIFEDTTGTDTIAAGDKLNYQMIVGTGGSLTVMNNSCIFDATTNTVSKFSVQGGDITATTAVFFGLTGHNSLGDATENNVKVRVRQSGTIKSLYVRIFSNSKAANSTITFRKNGANSSLAVTIGSNATGDFEDTTNSSSVAAGDDATISVLGTAAGTIQPCTMSTSLETTDGKGWLTGSSMGTVTQGEPQTRYYALGGFVVGGITTESQTQLKTREAITFSQLTIHISANTIGASSFRLRKNAANGNQLCSIGASATGYFTDTTNTDVCVATDLVNASLVTPATGGTQNMTIRSVGIVLATAGQFNRSPSSDSTTISDSSLTRLLSAARAPSADSPAVSDSSLTRTLQAFRSPSSDSVTIADSSLEGVHILPREPSVDTITISDSSLTRLLQATRSPVENESIGESLTRNTQAFRSPTAETETISDASLTRIKTLPRAPTADDTTVSDSSLTRLLSALRLPSTDITSISDSSLTRIFSALRAPSSDTIGLSENVDRVITNPGQFNRNVEDTVSIIEQSLTRLLSIIRSPSSDTSNINEQLTRIITLPRQPTSDSTAVSELSLTRIVFLARSVSADTANILEQSLTRLLQALRSPSTDSVTISELQNVITHSRSITETLNVTEPILERIVTSIRLISDNTSVGESLFYETFKRLVIESVSVNESLFYEREQLGGSMSYATPAEVRPLLGNLGTQRTDSQINLAIASAYDEINRRTNRIPPNDWKDTDIDWDIIKKIARLIATKEMAIGIKDFDTEYIEKEIERLYMLIEQHGGTESTSDLIVTSSSETYAAAEQGLIWSTRYRNLRKSPKGSGSENSIVLD